LQETILTKENLGDLIMSKNKNYNISSAQMEKPNKNFFDRIRKCKPITACKIVGVLFIGTFTLAWGITFNENNHTNKILLQTIERDFSVNKSSI